MISRTATDTDVPLLFELHQEAFGAQIHEIWGWDEAWQRANFAAEFTLATTDVIEIDGQIAGFVQVREDDRRIYLQNIVLVPASQGKGVGGRIVNDLKTMAADLRLPLELSVFRTNTRAAAFYQRLGFQVSDRDGDFVRMSWRSQS